VHGSFNAEPPIPTPGFSLDENLGPAEASAPSMITDSGGVNRDPTGERGLPSHLLPENANPPKPPLVSDSDRRALQRLVGRAVPQNELPSVIETIVSNVKAPDIVKTLQGNDAQTFADIMDEACHHAITSNKLVH